MQQHDGRRRGPPPARETRTMAGGSAALAWSRLGTPRARAPRPPAPPHRARGPSAPRPTTIAIGCRKRRSGGSSRVVVRPRCAADWVHAGHRQAVDIGAIPQNIAAVQALAHEADAFVQRDGTGVVGIHPAAPCAAPGPSGRRSRTRACISRWPTPRPCASGATAMPTDITCRRRIATPTGCRPARPYPPVPASRVGRSPAARSATIWRSVCRGQHLGQPGLPALRWCAATASGWQHRVVAHDAGEGSGTSVVARRDRRGQWRLRRRSPGGGEVNWAGGPGN